MRDRGGEADLVAQWRTDTPGCAHCMHLNNAGAALMPDSVLSAIQAHLQSEARCGGYEAADAAVEEVRTTYEAIAQLIEAAPRNIALVENATVAVAQALSAFDLERGDVIVTTHADYSSHQIMLLNLSQRLGVRVIRAEDLPEGGVDPEAVSALLQQQNCRLVLMSWVPTNSGLVQNARAVGALCAEAEVPFILDACQAAGQLPINVADLQCDFLAATARKFLRGPRGIGFLYASDRVLERGLHPLYLDTRGAEWCSSDAFRLEADARRFENWEFSYALVLGLGAAVRYSLQVGVETGGRRATALAAYARKKLAKDERVQVLDRGQVQCAIATAAVGARDASSLVELLRRENMNVSAILRDHAVIDMDTKGVTTALRISPHYYNTFDEVDTVVDAIVEAVDNSA